jgi:glycosyltransferase involved in cell wall biosynthesis
MTPPRVSIITPAYNHGRFIAAAIRSAQAQDLDAWEMWVIDDASTDGTTAAVAGFVANDPRVRLLRHEANWGMKRLADTYNQALERSRGEWIAILEGDDAWPPGKLERQLAQLERAPDVVLGYGRAQLISPNGMPLGETLGGVPRRFHRYFRDFCGPLLEPLLLRPCFIHPVTALIRRQALERIGGFQSFPGLGLTDHPTFLELAELGPFLGSSAVFGLYRRHPGSQSLNRIVELTRGERRLAFARLDGRPASGRRRRLRRSMERSWSLEEARALLTEGRLRLLRRQRRVARSSFRSSLKIAFGAPFPSLRRLALGLAALGILCASFLPVNPERVAGWARGRRASLLERSEGT